MGKTQQQYYDEIYQRALAEAEKQKAAREAEDAKTLATVNQSIDTAADTAAGIYQKNIDEAPRQYQAAYDENAVNEAFARKRVQESMANMGLTDSGYNLTTQTALTLQRGNADAAVAAEQRDYVRKLEDAIDAVRADAEQQKKAQALSAEAERQQWWDNILADLRTSSSTAAADMYAADQEYAAKQAQAAGDYASELNKQRESYALSLMKNMDYTEDQAWASAYARYPSGDAATDNYYSAYSRAINSGYSAVEADIYARDGEDAANDYITTSAESFVDGLDLKVSGWKTFFRNQNADGGVVATQISTMLEKDPAYTEKSAYEKQSILEIAIARCIYENWNGANDQKDNFARLKMASQKLRLNYQNVYTYYNLLQEQAPKATVGTIQPATVPTSIVPDTAKIAVPK